jgi:hypothetical protein
MTFKTFHEHFHSRVITRAKLANSAIIMTNSRQISIDSTYTASLGDVCKELHTLASSCLKRIEGVVVTILSELLPATIILYQR